MADIGMDCIFNYLIFIVSFHLFNCFNFGEKTFLEQSLFGSLTQHIGLFFNFYFSFCQYIEIGSTIPLVIDNEWFFFLPNSDALNNQIDSIIIQEIKTRNSFHYGNCFLLFFFKCSFETHHDINFIKD